MTDYFKHMLAEATRNTGDEIEALADKPTKKQVNEVVEDLQSIIRMLKDEAYD